MKEKQSKRHSLMVVINAIRVPEACYHRQSGVMYGLGGHKEQEMK